MVLTMVAERKQKEITPENLDKDSKVNPSSGLYARNPTREVIPYAENQRDIVDQIKNAGAQQRKIQYKYHRDEKGKWRYSGVPGTIYLKEMTENQLEEFFKTLLRSKPNVIGIELELGNYESKAPYTGSKLNTLSFNKPRNTSEVARDMASLFGDPSSQIVEFSWKINSAAAGGFRTTAAAQVATDKEEYDNEDNFSPILRIEYFQYA